jgi:hypothetical protein
MQQQLNSSVIIGQQTNSIFNLPNEVVVRVTTYKRGLDYPCGCRHCRELKSVPVRPATSALAAIDVYDAPDGVGIEKADYFH